MGEYFYLIHCDVCTDSNLHITVLGRTIDLIKARLEDLKVSLPQHLIVVAGKTLQGNRNQYVLGFLAKLICQGLFRSASTEYAEVGHTHNIQYQRFSIVATALAQQPMLQDTQATLDMMR